LNVHTNALIVQYRFEFGEIGRDGGLAASCPSACCAIGCAVDALTIGVATSYIQVRAVVLVATDDPEGAAADDSETVASGRGDEWCDIQNEPGLAVIRHGSI
jgi:hypothetical protein